jgi:hypothetical protein
MLTNLVHNKTHFSGQDIYKRNESCELQNMPVLVTMMPW